MENGREATWEDAMAHCSPEMKSLWGKALKEHGAKLETKKTPTRMAVQM